MIRLITTCIAIFFVSFGVLYAQEQEELEPDSTQQEQKFLQLDDSTRQVYGPNTTHYIQLPHIKYNWGGYRPVDTTIATLHQFSFVAQHHYKLQDLGNIGTAAQPIFYMFPKTIGVTSGFHSFDIYAKKPAQFLYYNTKSPFATLYWVLGEYGRNMLSVLYSRNIHKNWSIGANFRTLNVDKQFSIEFAPGDRNVISTAYDFCTHFKTDDERYQLLASFFRIKHRVKELGGVLVNKHSLKSIFNRNLTQKLRNNTISQDLRQHYHAYQQYILDDCYQVYHEFDWLNQVNYHCYRLPRLNLDEKKKIQQDKNFIRSMYNELGVKGNINKLFYIVYYRNQHIKPQALITQESITEHYFGGKVRYHWQDAMQVMSIRADYLLDGCYKIATHYHDRLVDILLQAAQYKPSLLVQKYTIKDKIWNNNFYKPIAIQCQAGVQFLGNFLQFKPRITWSHIQKHIYFNEQQHPTQTTSPIHTIAPSIEMNLLLWDNIHIDCECVYTTKQGLEKEVLHVPTWLINTSIYYQNNFFNDMLKLTTGIHLHFQSAYYAHDYDPTTQQFFLQNSFDVYEYLKADLFLNFRINNYSMFFNVGYINQGLWEPGYFTAPYYPGQKRVFDLGIRWFFFD